MGVCKGFWSGLMGFGQTICFPSLPLSPASLSSLPCHPQLCLPTSLSQYVTVSFVHHRLSIHVHLCGVSLAQSVDMSPSKSLAVCFCLHPRSFSLCAFLLPCEKLLRVFVTSSGHFHGDRPRLTALTEVSSWQGLEKAWRNVRVCKIGSAYVCLWVHFYLWACTHVWAVSSRQFESSFFLWKDYCDAYLSDIDK